MESVPASAGKQGIRFAAEPQVHHSPAAREGASGPLQNTGQRLYPVRHPPPYPVPGEKLTGWERETTAVGTLHIAQRAAGTQSHRFAEAVCDLSVSGGSAAHKTGVHKPFSRCATRTFLSPKQ